MLRGVVTGNVWSTKQIDGVPRGAFLDVEVDGSGSTMVAFDVLGSGIGERVIVATGSVAAAWFPGAPPPIDALIIGSVDEPAVQESAPTSPTRKTTAKKATAKKTTARRTSRTSG